MTDEKQKNEQVEEENELEEENGELLPDREVMTVINPSGGVTGGLGPPVLDDLGE
jgi:hypothetical protein